MSTTLSALTTADWTEVARRVRGPHYEDIWNWHLSPEEKGALIMGRECGRYLTVQLRCPQTGQFRLLARVARQGPLRVVPMAEREVRAAVAPSKGVLEV